MLLFISDFIQELGLSDVAANLLAVVCLLILILLTSYIIHIVLKRYVLNSKIVKNRVSSKSLWTKLAIKYGAFSKAYLLGQFIFVFMLVHMVQSDELPFTVSLNMLIQKFLTICIIIITTLLVSSALNIVNDIYQKSFAGAKQRPIKSYIDFLKIAIYILAGILIVSSIMNTSPAAMLAGFGALSAVLMLVFKDSILGFISSIQIAAYDIVRIGDWIEVKNYNVNGDIIDISLNTIKVQNFDKTIVTIPPYELIRNGIINWRGMVESGGRRIKRSLNIDIDTVKFCDKELLEKLSRFDHMPNYIKQTASENITDTLKSHSYDDRLTNLGLFRIYVKNYLKSRTDIHNEGFTFLVKLLQPAEFGVPLQLYVFTKTVIWSEYEDIQSEIFEHVISMLPHFGLRSFQKISNNYKNTYITKK